MRDADTEANVVPPPTPRFRQGSDCITPFRGPLALLAARGSRLAVLGQWNCILLAIGIAVVSNSSNYLILYMPTFAVTQLSLPASSGFIATLLGGVILTVGSPFIGHWSDVIGRTRIMLVAAALFLISAYPAFYW